MSTSRNKKGEVLMKEGVSARINLTPELNMAIIKRADQEGKSFEDIILEILEKEFSPREVD